MRSDAMTQFQAGNMPDGGRGTRVFFDKLWEKAGMPDNARVADKLMIALPLELTQEQRYEAVRSFMQELGKGRIAWCAAHHDSGTSRATTWSAASKSAAKPFTTASSIKAAA
jgi:hypothetical protein